MSHFDPTEALVAALERGEFDPRRTGPDSWESRCPAHNGERRNLSIARGDDGRVLLRCHAHGCAVESIVEALGISVSDLFRTSERQFTRHNGTPAANGRHTSHRRVFNSPEAAIAAVGRGKPTNVWTYHNVDGIGALRVARFDRPEGTKEFRPIGRIESGWVIGDPDGPLPLYHWPELMTAQRVYVTEGEKAADAARTLGVTATTSAHGANAARRSDWTPLSGKEVIILPDNDEPGERYLRDVLALLSKLEPRPTVRVVRLPSLPTGGDIVEWLADVVPNSWDRAECLAELERLAAGAVEENLNASASELESKNGAGKPRPRAKVTCAADVVCLPVEWLWSDRIPLSMLTLFAGDPKLGKSFVTLGIAAAVSRGVALPGDQAPAGRGSVMLVCAEDDLSRTIVPRLRAAGADLDRVHILESVLLVDGAEAIPNLRADIDAIEDAVVKIPDCRLIVIDPVSAYLGGTNDYRNAELRGLLHPLKTLAERTGVAIILVTHLNKGSGTNGQHRVTGSIAYVGACRANFLFARDREDPTGRRVFMLDNGCNLAGEIPTLAYQITDRGDGPAVEWEAAPVDIDVEQVLSAETENRQEREDRAWCDDWLKEVLSNGPVQQTEIVTQGRDAGLSEARLKRSKRRIGASTRRDGFGKGSKCFWFLPGVETDSGFEPP